MEKGAETKRGNTTPPCDEVMAAAAADVGGEEEKGRPSCSPRGEVAEVGSPLRWPPRNGNLTEESLLSSYRKFGPGLLSLLLLLFLLLLLLLLLLTAASLLLSSMSYSGLDETERCEWAGLDLSGGGDDVMVPAPGLVAGDTDSLLCRKWPLLKLGLGLSPISSSEKITQRLIYMFFKEKQIKKIVQRDICQYFSSIKRGNFVYNSI